MSLSHMSSVHSWLLKLFHQALCDRWENYGEVILLSCVWMLKKSLKYTYLEVFLKGKLNHYQVSEKIILVLLIWRLNWLVFSSYHWEYFQQVFASWPLPPAWTTPNMFHSLMVDGMYFTTVWLILTNWISKDCVAWFLRCTSLLCFSSHTLAFWYEKKMP
jgi:hypothetical protein